MATISIYVLLQKRLEKALVLEDIYWNKPLKVPRQMPSNMPTLEKKAVNGIGEHLALEISVFGQEGGPLNNWFTIN